MSDIVKDTNPKDAAAAVSGRVPLGVFPSTARIAGAMAMWEGRCKYGRYNYRIAGVLASVYYDALERHMEAWWNGEDMDPDSNLPHLWKALACVAILIDAQECGKLTDDRPPRAPVAAMLARLKRNVLEIADRLKDYRPHQYTIADSPELAEQQAKAETVISERAHKIMAGATAFAEAVDMLDEQAELHKERMEASQ